jgi:hypothetical protein
MSLAIGPGCSPLVVPTGRERQWDAVAAVPVGDREGLVKARLTDLMATLGELPGRRGLPRACHGALGGFLDDVCPAGTVVMHDRRVPGRDVRLQHLVIAPRGVVVVGPRWAPAGGGGHPAGRRADAPASTRGAAVPGVVRSTLRCAYALQSWLEGTDWAGAPVLAGVCTSPAEAAVARPPLVLDALWVGPLQCLPPWLASGDALDAADRGALGYFLAVQLPPG